MSKNYGALPLVVQLIAVLAIAIPIFLFGMGALISFFKMMSSPIVSGSIPVWAIFVGGMVLLFIMKRRKTNPYVV